MWDHGWQFGPRSRWRPRCSVRWPSQASDRCWPRVRRSDGRCRTEQVSSGIPSEPEAAYSLTFTRTGTFGYICALHPGSYEYLCLLHPSMRAKFTVTD